MKHVNEITCCDCVEGMRGLPDCCIPLTCTSPPYDGVRTYGGHSFDFRAVAEELYRTTMPGGVVAWVVQDQIVDGSETGTSAEQRLFFRDLGFRLHNTIIAAARVYRHPCSVRYPQMFQFVWILSKGKPRTVNIIRDRRNVTAGSPLKQSYRGVDGVLIIQKVLGRVVPDFGSRGNVWTYKVGGGHTTKDKVAYQHPALMAEQLAEDLIISFSRPGDLVLDPFAGAATTCKMALLNNRRFLGFEVFDEYHEIACERVELARTIHRQALDDWLGAGR